MGDGKQIKLGLKNAQSEVTDLNAFLSVRLDQEVPEFRIRLRAGQHDEREGERSLQIMEGSLKQGIGEMKMSVTHGKAFDHWKADLTYLGIAYLRLFHEMGYEWLFSPIGQLIRRQLAEPEQRIAPLHRFGLGDGFGENVTIAICFADSDARGIYVPIPPSPVFDRWSAVYLPMLDEDYPPQMPQSVLGPINPVTTYRTSHSLIDQPDMRMFWYRQMYPDRRYSWKIEMDASDGTSDGESEHIALHYSE